MSTLPPNATAGRASEYEAEFTTEQANDVRCSRCNAIFPSGTKLKWIHNKNSTQPGRLLCTECFQHYQNKETTRRRPQPSHQGYANPGLSQSLARNALENQTMIRQQVAAAQRVDGAYPMVALGVLPQAAQAGHALPANFVAHPPAPTPRLPVHQGFRAPEQPSRPGSTPHINIPPGNPYSSLPFPPLLKAKAQSLINPGYQEAHELYNEMRAHFANKAYSTSANTELVVVKVWMMTRLPARKNPIQVLDVFEALSNIPVHVGAHDLKWIVYHGLLPHYVKWLRGFPLTMEECEVRNKLWVELVPKQPDVDVIADHFFSLKGKNKLAKQFSPKQGIDLSLSISYEKYEAILQHIEELDNPSDLHVSYGVSDSYAGPSRKSRQSTQNKRKVPVSPDRNMTNQISNAIEASPLSPPPTLNEVKHALLLQQLPRKKNMQSLLETVIIALHFFWPPSTPSFAELVKSPQFLLHPEEFPPLQVSLSYCPSAKPLHGAFKLAYMGHTTFPLFGNSTQVCIKQTFFTPAESKKPVVYQGQMQASNLSIELNCLGWASALMDLVYRFMKKEEHIRGQPNFIVPQMRYAQAGLGVSKDASGKFSAYLIEEYIESEEVSGGWFVKYINNNSAIPVVFENKEQMIRAEFLSFSQHVQFIETGGLAFVSDLQGGHTLLTDPQIITNPTLVGFLFGEGNTNFETFVAEHTCNRFCKFYQLPRPMAETQLPLSGASNCIPSPAASSEASLPQNPLHFNTRHPSLPDTESGTAPMDISVGI